ncbi:MAG: phage shock protein operon transcriptional activator [Desulfobacterales bacterium]
MGDMREALGQSDVFLAFQDRLSRVATVERPVLLIGERGTGKELAASRLHFLSRRWQGPLIALNCAALSPALIESELFGYEKGAFTGAAQRRSGRFEAADGGTLFLDEMGNIPLEVQEKILRVVEYGAFERVGSAERIEADARIIAATHANLPKLVAAGRFKQDLLDRLSFEVLFLPPLRERREDILLLADHFAARMFFELGREGTVHIGEEAARALAAHTWPGNIRELKNVVERAVYRSDTPVVTTVVFDPFDNPFAARPTPGPSDTTRGHSAATAVPDLPPKPFKTAIRHFERHLLKEALEAEQFQQKRAAARLGLTYHQFRGLYRRHRSHLI